MDVIGNFVQTMFLLVSVALAASCSVLAYSATTRIGNLNWNAAVFYVPLMLLGMYFVPMIPSMKDENFLSGLFISFGSLFLTIIYPFAAIYFIVEYFGGRHPDKAYD